MHFMQQKERKNAQDTQLGFNIKKCKYQKPAYLYLLASQVHSNLQYHISQQKQKYAGNFQNSLCHIKFKQKGLHNTFKKQNEESAAVSRKKKVHTY